MKYNFDTILKEFKPIKEEVVEDNDIFENCIVSLIFVGIICVISMI